MFNINSGLTDAADLLDLVALGLIEIVLDKLAKDQPVDLFFRCLDIHLLALGRGFQLQFFREHGIAKTLTTSRSVLAVLQIQCIGVRLTHDSLDYDFNICK